MKRKAPVLVIYNHTGFWHAVTVVGYNDNADNEGCPFVSTFKDKMDKRPRRFEKRQHRQMIQKTREDF